MAKLNNLSTETVKDYEELEHKVDNSHDLIYIKEPNEFSSATLIEFPTNEEMQRFREWKNSIIEMRDRYKGKYLYNVFNEEARRVIEFLNKF